MAPHSSGSFDASISWLEPRHLGSNGTITPEYTQSQENILEILALVFATISVASAILAFYWFVKMRRSFRHDLIMLLIQSDMFKALWFMIYPIVVFSHGPVPDTSTFCQVNGFFLSVGIESSDIAVLMIAIHSALYIFRSKGSNGEGGLYPYRHIAYAIWFFFPIVMASLAFVNNGNSFTTEGTYCYLPVRPFWYRLALAWIPRYIIFIVILGIYVSIYYYVRYKQNGFNEAESRFSAPTRPLIERHQKQLRRNTVPPTPTLACHGLIPESPEPANELEKIPEPAVPPETYKPSRSKSNAGAHRFMLASIVAVNTESLTPPSEPSIVDADSFTSPSTPQPLPRFVMATSPRSVTSIESELPIDSRATSWRDGFVARFSPPTTGPTSHQPSIVDIFTVLRHQPNSSDISSPISPLQLINSRGQTFVEAEMLRTRDKIRRQLRFLFIYPLVYIGMWILPFVSHVLQYDDRFAVNPPFGLTCITTISVCMQAAVDCWLFSTREKPWRHIPGTKGGFWESLKFWTGWKGHGKRRVIHGPGKTREEMVREARAAYRRRDQEIAQRRTETESPNHFMEGRRGERSWWDVDGAGENMSPLVEESNPMEDVEISDEESRSDGSTTLKESETTLSGEIGHERRS